MSIHLPRGNNPELISFSEKVHPKSSVTHKAAPTAAQDRLASGAVNPPRSTAARIKQGFLNFCGWVYLLCAKNTTLAEACEQGNLWLVRGFAFLRNLPQTTLQQCVYAASQKNQWKIVLYFAECFGCFTINDQNLTPLHRLIRHGHVETALHLIPLLSPEALQISSEGATPLRTALKYGQVRLAKALIECDPKAAQKLLFQMIADPASKPEELKNFLDAGMDANMRNEKQETLIDAAIAAHRPDLMAVAVQKGADPNLPSGTAGVLPINLISEETQRCKEMLEALHTGGKLDLKQNDQDGRQPIHYAAMMGNTEALGWLLDQGIDVETKAEKRGNFTPLHFAILKNHEKAAGLLLDRGAQNTPDKSSKTPLGYAYECELSLQLCHRLLEMSSNLASEGESLLTHMMERNDDEGIEMLAGKGVDISSFVESISTERDESVVLEAYRKGFYAIVAAFVQKGRGLSAQDSSGMHLIHMAARDGNQKLAQLLIAQKVSVKDSAFYIGKTPFQLALEKGHVDLALDLLGKAPLTKGDLKSLSAAKFREFVEKGVTRKLLTPQQFLTTAIRSGDISFVEFLIASGADPIVRDPKTLQTPFHIAAWFDSSGKIVRYLAARLYEKGNSIAFLMQVDKDGNTPLHLAAAKGNSQAAAVILGALRFHLRKSGIPMQQLLSYVNAINIEGNTALHYAAGGNHTQVANLLIQLGANQKVKNAQGQAPEPIQSTFDKATSFVSDVLKDMFKL